MNISDLALQIRTTGESLGSTTTPQSSSAEESNPSKADALRRFTQSLITALKLNEDSASTIRTLLRPLKLTEPISGDPKSIAFNESSFVSPEKIETLLKTILTAGFLGSNLSDQAHPNGNVSNWSAKLIESIKTAIEALSTKSSNADLVSNQAEFAPLLKQLLQDSSLEDLLALLGKGADRVVGDVKRLLEVLMEKSQSPLINLLFQLSGFEESISQVDDEKSQSLKGIARELIDNIAKSLASGGQDKELKAILLDGKDKFEEMLEAPQQSALSVPVMRSLQNLKRSLEFYLAIPVLTDQSPEAVKSDLVEIRSQAVNLVKTLSNEGFQGHAAKLQEVVEFLDKSTTMGDRVLTREALGKLSKCLEDIGLSFDSQSNQFKFYGDLLVPTDGKIPVDIHKSIEGLKNLIRKVIFELTSKDLASESSEFLKLTNQVTEDLLEAARHPGQSVENQIALRKLAERLSDSSIRRDEALNLLRRSEQLVSRMSLSRSNIEFDTESPLEKLAKGQEFLQTINPLMAKLGEPIFMFFPSLLDGLLSKVEVSLFKADEELKFGKNGKKGSGKGAYSCAAVSLTLPNLGKLTVHVAHRTSELLVMITSFDEMVSDFLDKNKVCLSDRLKGIGFESCEIVCRTASLVSTAPQWVEKLVERSGIVA